MRRIMTTMVVAALLASVVPVYGGVTGYTAVTVPGNSVAAVSMPFVKNAEGTFTVSAVSGTGVTSSESLSEEYDGTYYVRFTTGDAKGRWSTISSTSGNVITLEDTSIVTDQDGNAAVGDKFKVIKHVTMDDVFPGTLYGLSYRESGLTKYEVGGTTYTFLDTNKVGTEVVVFPDPSTTTTSPGPNKRPSKIYVYAEGMWRNTTAIGSDAGSDILPPDKYMYIRNTTSSGKVTFLTTGQVSFDPTTVKLVSSASANSDHPVAAAAVPMKLSELNLGGTAAFEDSTLVTYGGYTFLDEAKDELRVFKPGEDNPSKIYVYAEGHWRNTESIGTIADDDVIPAARGFVIRKIAGSSGSVIWVNE